MHRFFQMTLALTGIILSSYSAEGHFFGPTKSVGDYQAVLQTFPTYPSSGEPTHLGFSLLDTNGNNVFNVAVSTEIKQGDNVVMTFPEKRYEFSDISQIYTFPADGNYKIIYHAKVAADDDPVTVDFDLLVGEPANIGWEIALIPIALAVGAAIALIIIKKRRIGIKR